jgi:Tol biopolymer transport system component
VNVHRLTLSDSWDHAYAWTPDSKSVLFDSNRNGTWDVFIQALDQRTAEKLVPSPGGSMRPAISPDEVSVLYLIPPAEPGLHPPLRIMRVPLAGWSAAPSSTTSNTLLRVDLAGKVRLLGAQKAGWFDAVPSPDGRHVAIRGFPVLSNVWLLENL